MKAFGQDREEVVTVWKRTHSSLILCFGVILLRTMKMAGYVAVTEEIEDCVQKFCWKISRVE
jgi:hypothetical protein